MSDNQSQYLPTKLLQQYIDTFYGYGSWSTSKFWFIGIEEGGGNEKKDLERRLSSWENLGKSDLIDCKLHHQNTGSFTKTLLLKMHSRTWTRLILTKLGFQTIPKTHEAMLNIQNNDWGITNSDNLLVELLPLPSPGLKYWNYKDWVDLNSSLSFLSDRNAYKLKVIETRVNYIRSKIAEHHPVVVLFYGKMMESHWDSIINSNKELDCFKIGDHSVRYIKIDKTLYVQCPQPTYIMAYAFWTELGHKIKTWL